MLQNTLILNMPASIFFESHEGKDASDSTGSIVKCAFIRGMLKSEQCITGIDDILSVIASEIKSKTKKFEFFVVEKFERFLKKTHKLHNYCKVPGIMGLHILKLCGDKIVLSELTCNECTHDILCENCSLFSDVDKNQIEIPNSIEYVSTDEQTDKIEESNNSINDEDDHGQTDASDESDGELDDDVELW